MVRIYSFGRQSAWNLNPSSTTYDFPGGLDGKEFATMQETWVRSLGWEDPLEKEMATHSSTLAWENSVDRWAWQATVHTVHGVTKS